jgi:hypothetical protein
MDRYKKRKKEELKDIKVTLAQVGDESIDRVYEAIDTNKITISKEYAQERFAKTKFVVVDEFSTLLRDANQYGRVTSILNKPDSYSWTVDRGDEHYVYISELTPDDRFEYSVQHELTHVLSGKTYPGNPEKKLPFVTRETQESAFPEDIRRSGLHFISQTDSGSGVERSRFAWLDEAVAHDITIRIFPNSSLRNTLYSLEHTLYTIIKKFGRDKLDESLFDAAFFENYDDYEQPQAGLPQWRKCYTALSDSLGKGFIELLDDEMQLTNHAGKLELLTRLAHSEKPLTTRVFDWSALC